MQPERIVLSQEALQAAVGDRWSAAEVGEVANLLEDGEGKFPAGARTVASELIKAVQRERVLAAMLRAVAELGYREASVQDVLDRAGVSRPTFYEHFENKEDCFLAAFDAAAARLGGRIDGAIAASGGDWRDRLALGMGALLEFLTAEPDAAKALVVEARAASPAGLRRRNQLLERIGGCIEEQVRGEFSEPPSSIAATGVVGGVEAVLYSRINGGGDEDLESLLPSLMYFAVMPYAGKEAAARELVA